MRELRARATSCRRRPRLDLGNGLVKCKILWGYGREKKDMKMERTHD